MTILKVEHLSKTYKTGKQALVDLNFAVQDGEILGFLGPNGAGKSTTINIISTLLKADSGTIVYFNNPQMPRKEVKQKLGIVPQDIALYEDISAYENVKFFAALYGVHRQEMRKKVENALAKVGLLERQADKPATFSGGMKRRLNIACAIVHNPKIIIMDEPTVGIDAQSRNHILDSIKKLNEEGTTIIYTSHYMEEVESICTKIAIIDHGKVIVEGTKDELKSIVDDKKTLSLTLNSYEEINIEEIKSIKGVLSVYQDDNLVTINTSKNVNNLDKIINYFTRNEISIGDIGYREVTLETVFLTLTGRSLRE